MKKIIVVLVFSINLFALPCNFTGVAVKNSQTTITSSGSGSSSTAPTLPDATFCNTNSYILRHWNAGIVTGDNGAPKYKTYYYSYTGTDIEYIAASSCPSGQVPDSNGVCYDPPNCAWATTPPWYKTTRSQSTCNNANGYGGSSEDPIDIYYFNHTWCESDSFCYARKYHCPAGTAYDYNTKSCLPPSKPKPDGKFCPQGYYPTAIKMISSAVSGEICGQDWICKNNPAIVLHREFSCGAGPVDDQFPPTNPDAPIEEDSPYTKDYGDHSAACGTKKMLAQSSCQSPNVLSFSCDPRTGNVTKQECKSPTVPDDKPINPEDSTTGSTTADIKDLANSLPKSIKEALSDFFTDGSMSHLESIKGSLESSLHLQADTVSAVNNLENSVNAGLSLQAEANSKLDGIKDAVENSSKEGMTSEAFNGFNDNGNFQDPNESNNNSVLDDISDFTSQLIGDATSISTQYDDAKSSIQNGFQPVSLPSGSCSDISFSIPGSNVQSSIPLSRVPSVISPYSPIFSLLVYMTVMFFIFKFLFLFFISRSR